ncbi:MAG: WD40 repeat domain-containing protein [Kofleriaceae bacterium]
MLGRRVLVTTHAGAVIGFSVDGDEVFHIQAHPTVSSLSVSPDETTFATAGAESSVKLWRTEDGVQVATLPHASEIYFVDYSHDGKVLVAKTNESTATLWDPQRRLLLGRIDAGNELDTALVADGGSAVFTTTRTGLVQVWDLLPDNVVTAFDDHRAEVWSATISQDGKTAATLGADMAVRTWELETGKPIARLDAAGPNGRDVLERIAYLPDGRIAAPYDYGVAIWDVARRLRVGFVRPDFDARTIAVDSRGTRIAVANAIRFGTEPYHVIVWDLAEERVVGRHVTSDEAFDVAFDPTGSRLAIATKGKLLELWDIDQDRVIWRADNRVFDVDFSRDGHYVTASSDDGYARIWNAETGEVVMELKQPGRALAVALSPDASLLATAVTDNRIYLWDVATGKLAGTRVGHDNIINSLVFAPDGSRLVSVGRDRRAIEWSVPSEQRSPAELAATVASKVPFRIVGAELVANDRQP